MFVISWMREKFRRRFFWKYEMYQRDVFILATFSSFLLTFMGSDVYSQTPPDEIKGVEYRPKSNLKIEGGGNSQWYAELYLPHDLSDWEQLKSFAYSGGTMHIINAKLLDFSALRNYELGSEINIKIVDEKYLKMFEVGIDSQHVFRPCESDLGTSFGGFPGETYVGGLKFELSNSESIVVGVGQTSFFLGTWYGTNRRAFYSKPLAEALRRYFAEHPELSISINHEIYKQLSGDFLQDLPAVFHEK